MYANVCRLYEQSKQLPFNRKKECKEPDNAKIYVHGMYKEHVFIIVYK